MRSLHNRFSVRLVYSRIAVRGAAIDLSKQQALAADSKAIRQINFTGNLDRSG